MAKTPDLSPEERAERIYPHDTVEMWTKQLEKFNNELEFIIEVIDQIDPVRMLMDYVAEVIQQACAWINYWLACFRYEIVSTLRKLYKSSVDVPIPDSLSDVLEILLGPYNKYVDLAEDIEDNIINPDYEPNFPDELDEFVENVGTVAAEVPGKLKDIVEQSPQIPSQAAQTALSNVDIHVDGMDAITILQQITGDDPIPKPEPPGDSVKSIVDWKNSTVYKDAKRDFTKTKEWYDEKRKTTQSIERTKMGKATGTDENKIIHYTGDSTGQFESGKYYTCKNVGTEASIKYEWVETTME